MKNNISLSIQPTFLCNYNCDYCYLGKLRKDKTVLDLNILKNRLEEITNRYNITDITVFGGEISLLDEEYIDELYNLCKSYSKITFVSNLSNDWIIDYCDNNKSTLSISLNEERPYYNETVEKLKKIKIKNNKNLSIVVLPSLLNKSPKDIMRFYNELGFDLFFIQYHPSILSKRVYEVDINDFSNFLIKIIAEKHTESYNINIVNEKPLNNDDYNPMMNGFLFITPNGKYSTVFYNKHIEQFKIFDDINDWERFCHLEYKEYLSKCCFCELFGKCKAEHLEVFETKECSGLYNLLKWYKGKRWN